MARVLLSTRLLRSPHSTRRSGIRKSRPGSTVSHADAIRLSGAALSISALLAGALAVYAAIAIHSRFTFSLQSPMLFHFQSPVVVSRRTETQNAFDAQSDQGRSLTAYQQYACRKFGSACRIALAIQRAENPQGKCELYHYNSDGTLDWGYFQINTVHLKRPGLNLRDLLDCKANIDFAYQLYVEKHGFSAWSTYNNGAYRRALRD